MTGFLSKQALLKMEEQSLRESAKRVYQLQIKQAVNPASESARQLDNMSHFYAGQIRRFHEP